MALQVKTQSAKIHVLVVASPSLHLCHSQIPSGCALQIPLQSLWCWDQSSGFCNPQHQGNWLSLVGSSFPLEELKA